MTSVVPLHVAVAIVGTGWCVVTGDPVLVEVLTPARRRHIDRAAPTQPAVDRSVDDHRRALDPTRRLAQQEAVDEPDAVLGVEDHRRIGVTGILAGGAGENGRAG